MTTTATTAYIEKAQPKPGTVRDSYGDPCSRAVPDSYPLRAICGWCSADIRCASGDADWSHKRTRRIACEVR